MNLINILFRHIEEQKMAFVLLPLVASDVTTQVGMCLKSLSEPGFLKKVGEKSRCRCLSLCGEECVVPHSPQTGIPNMQT